jgi:hypothetical protein
MGMADRTPPTPDEYLSWRETFCNWQRWGEADELGTLNFVTDSVRVEAAHLVETGRIVGLARSVDTQPSAINPFPAHHMVACEGAGGLLDYVGMFIHGLATTHIDALCHIATSDGRVWNDHAMGAQGMPRDHSGTIDFWRNGISTRGVLYDIPRLRGTRYVEPGSPVMAWELLDAANNQRVTPQSGDAVVVRCGRGEYDNDHHEPTAGFGLPSGLHAGVLEFLHATEAALLLWDWIDAPADEQGLPALSTHGFPMHLHDIALPFMGLPLVDNAELEMLARVCEEHNRWTFQLTVAPLVISRGTGSPVNPIALF